jgi:uncharacterized membrane protein
MYNLWAAQTTVNDPTMDIGIIAAVAMLVVWAFVTFTTAAPGWVHIFLTLGVFLLIQRFAARNSRKPRHTEPGTVRK